MGDAAAAHSYPPSPPHHPPLPPTIPHAAPTTTAAIHPPTPLPSTPKSTHSKQGRTSTLAPTKKDMLIKELSCHATLIIAGWSDASSGPLIPYIQAQWSLSYTTVSLLFVGQMVGFLAGALSNGWLTGRYGMGRVITAGAVVQAVGYVFLIPAFGFATFPICYAILGFGMSLQDAQANTFVASLPHADHKLHLLHASYGLGAVVCPLAATAFASSGIKFSYFYSLSVGLALVNVGVLLWGFRFSYRMPQDEEGGEVGAEASEEGSEVELRDVGGELEQREAGNEEDVEKGTPPGSPSVGRGDGQGVGTVEGAGSVAERPRRGMLAETLSMPQLWLFAIFIVLYVGAEVSTGG